MFKGQDVKTQEHCDQMWYWLQEMGVNSHRSGIVTAVAGILTIFMYLLEKLNTMMPGIFDESELKEK